MISKRSRRVPISDHREVSKASYRGSISSFTERREHSPTRVSGGGAVPRNCLLTSIILFVFDRSGRRPHSPRMNSFRILALGMAATLTISSCGGNPPPRSSGPRPVNGEAVRVASIPRTPPPPVVAESVLVVDLTSGRNLYAKNADTVRPVASTQKLITAMCVLDAGDIDRHLGGEGFLRRHASGPSRNATAAARARRAV